MANHHPPHIHLDHTWYIITASTVGYTRHLASNYAKDLVRDTLRKLAEEFNIALSAWVILDDHYHLLLKTGAGRSLPRFIGRLHGSTSRRLNLWEGKTGRQVWHNYWDTCLRDEAGYWTRFNYIHLNPVKHGYVARCEDWPWSSYRYYRRAKGEEWLTDCWQRYPAVDLSPDDAFGRGQGGEPAVDGG
jgi:putative transposase